MGEIMCEHEYEIEGEVLEVTFDENDLADIVARKCWRCYDCSAVMDVQEQEAA